MYFFYKLYLYTYYVYQCDQSGNINIVLSVDVAQVLVFEFCTEITALLFPLWVTNFLRCMHTYVIGDQLNDAY